MRHVLPAMLAVLCCGVASAEAAEESAPPLKLPVPVVALHSLYGSYAALSVLDWQTTRMAMRGGYREANPLISPFARHSAALLVVKGAAAASTIYFTERLRARHPKAAVAAIVAANTISALVVTRNAMAISGGGPGSRAR